MYHNSFPYPPTDEHLDCLQVLAIKVATCAAIHILLLVSLHTGTGIFTGNIHGGAFAGLRVCSFAVLLDTVQQSSTRRY